LKKDTNNRKERIGVHEIGLKFYKEFDLVFREQPIEDFGIDATIEEKVDGTPTGRMIGVQIKSGESHVYKSKSNGDLFFYFTENHYRYWINHSLPIIVICLYSEDSPPVWEVINGETVIKGKKGYKVNLQYTLTSNNARRLKSLFKRFFEVSIYKSEQPNTNVFLEEIKMKVNSENAPLEYLYPVIKSDNPTVEKSINYQIKEGILDFLEPHNNKRLSTKKAGALLEYLKDYYLKYFGGGIMFIDYETYRLDDRFLSLRLEYVTIGAYSHVNHEYYCFDLATGNRLTIKNMIKPYTLGQLIEELQIMKRVRFKDHIGKLKDDDYHTKEHLEGEIKHYSEVTIETIERFFITHSEIGFDLMYGFPNVIKALEPNNIFLFKIEKFDKYLNPNILN